VRNRVRMATTAAVIAVLSLGACAGPPPEGARLDRPVEFVGVSDKPWTDDGMAAASVRLATKLVAARAGANAVVSPLSLQLVLAVLREGTSGRAAEQLDAALGLPDGGGSQVVADLRARLARFEGDVATVDRDHPPDRPLVHIADGVFIQRASPWNRGSSSGQRPITGHRYTRLTSPAAAPSRCSTHG